MSRRRPLPSECEHPGPILIDPGNGGVVARCLLCGTVGPKRGTSQEALHALEEQVARNRRERRRDNGGAANGGAA